MIARHMQVAGRLVAGLLVVLCLARCAATDQSADGASSGASTGVLTLQMRITGEDNLAVVYRVTERGVFEFSGGQDAHLDRVTWSTQLTSTEIEQLNRAIADNRWYTQPPEDGERGDSADRAQTIDVRGRGPSGRLRFVIHGVHDRVEPVRLLLQAIADRRLALDLETLPQAGDEAR